MGLAWQQGPLASGAVGRFLVPDPLPERLLYAEPLRRRMRVRFGGTWIADSDDVVLLHEPARYPVAYFPVGAVADAYHRIDIRQTSRHLLVRDGDRVKVEVHLDGARLRLEPGQSVIPHGPDRDLTTDELAPGRQA
jgi:Domain of unknown function (DUF427)